MLSFGIKDVIDILLVAALMYYTYKLMRSSGNLAIFGGVVSVIVVWLLTSRVLDMQLTGAILDTVINVGFFVLVVLFQNEIRNFLKDVGNKTGFKLFRNLFEHKTDKDDSEYITPLTLACINMAKSRTGALIVVQRDNNLSQYIRTGEVFRAEVNTRLIESIFFKNSPLHDCAMIIVGNEIKAAGCTLPVDRNIVMSKNFGTRHRAGLTMSHETDALVIIVSEESGKISIATNGELITNISADDLQQYLSGGEIRN
ncbi:MAG: diadenylate cyclase CdaA [Tannerella sp.]|jgi:uncharacterized protein (TIGR00159 family)|nr:diadenylate cyclase CdaA [Tannerella sp.]